MDKTTKQTALFFGFLASAMTYASVQPAQATSPAANAPAIERQAGDLSRIQANAPDDARRAVSAERRKRA